jgi:hypothetical protein
MTPPRLRRTGPIDLAVPFVVVGVAAYAILRVTWDSLPPLGWLVPVPIAALGFVEFMLARRVRAAVRHEPNAKPMPAISIARCVALAKASSPVGAAVAGAALALLGRVLPEAGDVSAAAHDARVTALLLAASVVLVVAGLVLERAGIDPRSENHDKGDDRE